MKQVIEDNRSGKVSVPEVPIPSCRTGSVFVHNHASLISAGTEAAMLKFGSQSYLQKAKSRPDLVKQVLSKVKADGISATLETVRSRLSVPTPLGYSCAGEVLQVGEGVEFQKGDRVACAGHGYASHAEAVVVPKNLVVPIPDNVSFEDAAFSTVGAIALQGVRIANVHLGERVVVIGMGIIGLLTVQILKASGCSVLGTDISPARVALGAELGANQTHVLDPATILEAVMGFTQGRGADCVIITAATKSNEPIEMAGEMSRMKGRVVVVGEVSMNIPRRTYYYKELDLRLSMSYGPGRYDPNYEERGIDYPYAYVPFTEQRNLESFLTLVSEGKVTPSRLVTHRFAIEDAERAYALIKGDTKEPFMGVLFQYPQVLDLKRRVEIPIEGGAKPSGDGSVKVGVIGAGQYARQMLLPKIKDLPNVSLVGLATSRGITSYDGAKAFGFQYATTETKQILEDKNINSVIIATRHDSHAPLAISAMNAGKHVFVEKPLATNETDLRAIIETVNRTQKHIFVGFNRRFAPLVQQAKEKFRNHTQPLSMLYRINSGAIPAVSWVQDSEEGGGRIIGEVCHFVDLLQYLCGSRPVSVYAQAVGGNTGGIPAEDVISITIRFEDGSIGTIHYFSNGDKAVSKEYLEVFGGGKVYILEDFRSAKFVEGGKINVWKGQGQDKGQQSQMQAMAEAIRKGGSSSIPLEELVATTLTTFRVRDSLRTRKEEPVEWSAEALTTALDPSENLVIPLDLLEGYVESEE